MSLPERHEHTPPTGVKWHEYANVFPWLEGAALDALREDIRANGVREPIVFLGEYILDGRNRYQCARDLGIDYPRREFGSQESDGDDPLAFVISHNLTRRHLTESQRAQAGTRLASMKRGNPEFGKSANLRNSGMTTEEAAKMLNVSPRSIETARSVQAKAPEISPLIDDGSLSVFLASKVAELPEETRAEIVETPANEIRERARDEVKKRAVTVTLNTGKVEWYTPLAVLNAAREVLGGFDLDPASSEAANENVNAAHIFTETDDGLSQTWPKGRIWMNPPYAANLVGKFVSRFCEEMENGSTGMVLINNATETGWFHQLASVASAVCFPKGRLRFICPTEGDKGTPLQGQAIFYCGPDVDAFHAHFSSMGVVLCPRR